MKQIEKVSLLILILTCSLSNAQVSDPKKENSPIESKTTNQNRFYYFPNLQAYFDNLKNVYYYKENGNWITAKELPLNYGGYSIYNKVKVLIADFNEDNPNQFIKIHKKLYPYNSKGRFPNATALNE